MVTGLHYSCSSQIDLVLKPLLLSSYKNVFKGFSFKIWNEGRLLKDICQRWLIPYKTPFPHEYVLEVGEGRVVLHYKGQCFLECIFVSLF